jgi:Flp pilus assembly protein TadD
MQIVRGSPAMDIAALKNTSQPRAKEENPITVEPWFERVGNRVEDQFSAPETPMPPIKRNGHLPASAAAARRSGQRPNVEESAKKSAHREMSTAGNDPSLDRDIALARARVVRSPNSVTACYRLSTLLMRRGEQDGFTEAIHTLHRVMELEPNHPGAHHAAAEACVRRGDFELAADHLSRARRLGYRIDPALERAIAEGRTK